MAKASIVSKSLRATATKLAKITDDTVADAAEFAVTEAIRVGGTMKGYALYAEISKYSNRGSTSSATVEGVPSGFWAIKSFGRRGGYTVRAADAGAVINLRAAGIDGKSAARSAYIGSATGGDGRWDTVADNTRLEFGDMIESRIGEVIARG